MNLPASLQAQRGRLQVVSGPGVKEFTDKLHNGVPTVGWSGHRDLQLCADGARYEIWHFMQDGTAYRVKVVLPNQLATNEIFMDLVAMDQSRVDVFKQMEVQNQKAQKAIEDRRDEALAPIHDKLAWALRKDLR